MDKACVPKSIVKPQFWLVAELSTSWISGVEPWQSLIWFPKSIISWPYESHSLPEYVVLGFWIVDLRLKVVSCPKVELFPITPTTSILTPPDVCKAMASLPLKPVTVLLVTSAV